MKKVLFVFILIGTTSCSRTIFFLYGMTPPKVISAEKIEQKSKDYGLLSNVSLSITEKGFIDYISYDYSLNSLFIYSQDGHQIKPKSKNKCSGRVEDFIDVFKDSTYTDYVDTCDSNYFNLQFVHLNGDTAVIQSNKPYQAIIFWSVFGGRKMSSSTSSEWSKRLIKDDDVNVIIVALDPREFWSDFTAAKVKTKFSLER